MAAENAPRSDTKDHAKTYSGFLTMTKWATILVTIVLIGLFAFVFSE